MAQNIELAIRQASECLYRSETAAARTLCEEVLDVDGNNPEALYLLGIADLQDGRRGAALLLFEKATENRHNFPLAHFHLAKALNGTGHRGAAKARKHLRIAISQRPDWFEALYLLGRTTVALGPIEEAERSFRMAVQLNPSHADSHYRLSECYTQLERLDAARRHLERAVTLNPTVAQAAREDLAELKAVVNLSRTPTRKARYPDTVDIQERFRDTVLRQVITERPEAPLFDRSSTIFTMGSCFARNIVRHLRSSGYTADLLDISEYINSTYANRFMVDWLRGTLDGEVKERIDSLLPEPGARERLLHNLTHCDVFVFTLGVAPCFFEKGTNTFIMPRPSSINSRALAERYEFRTTSVEENVENVRYVLDFIRQINPDVKVVITLSPVPLHATFEFSSAVTADCISKSVLRVAAHQLMQQGIPNLHYWPSFEIVRWLGAHTGPVYGVDDGASWHVSEELIHMIVDLFVEVHGAEGR